MPSRPDPAPLPMAEPRALAEPRVVAEPRNLTVEAFRALSDPVRLDLIAQIAARGPICVCHLEDALALPQPRISKHLAVLRRAGLVSSRREGSWVYYSVEQEGLEIAREFLEQLESSLAELRVADACD